MMSSGREQETRWSRALSIVLTTLAFTLSEMRSLWRVTLSGGTESFFLDITLSTTLRPSLQGKCKGKGEHTVVWVKDEGGLHPAGAHGDSEEQLAPGCSGGNSD